MARNRPRFQLHWEIRCENILSGPTFKSSLERVNEIFGNPGWASEN